jgi:hypothetical protein
MKRYDVRNLRAVAFLVLESTGVVEVKDFMTSRSELQQ